MLQKSEKKSEWVDFSLKIVFIYEKLFKKQKKTLLEHFSPPNLSLEEKQKRQRTINNWLNEKKSIKRPNKFKIDLFKISDYKMPDGTQLLPHDAFELWSLDKFKERVNNYLALKQQTTTKEERMKYIYYFNLDKETLDYYQIIFPNIENKNELNLYSPKLAYSMLYRGAITEFQGMLYINVKNKFDHMSYIFENFTSVFTDEVRVFGTGQCKDYYSRKPKAYMALLSSSRLSEEEKNIYTHKLNRSNLFIAKPFTRETTLSHNYSIENFTSKVAQLAKDLEETREKSYDLYETLALKTFRTYEQIAQRLSHNEAYFVHNKKSLKELIFKTLEEEKTEVDILYALTSSNIRLLKNNLLYFSSKLKINILFVVTNKELLTNRVIEEIREIAQHISVKIVKNNHTPYEEIIYPKDEKFVIFQKANEFGHYVYITKHSKEKMDIRRAYELLYEKALELEEFVEKECQLNGEWYHYSFGSNIDNEHYHTIKMTITNHQIHAQFPSEIHSGVVQNFKNYTLLLMGKSIIKIRERDLSRDFFKVSIIGEELNAYHKDILLFGIMSREALKKEHILKLLNMLPQQEEEHFRLRVSDEFEA